MSKENEIKNSFQEYCQTNPDLTSLKNWFKMLFSKSQHKKDLELAEEIQKEHDETTDCDDSVEDSTTAHRSLW